MVGKWLIAGRDAVYVPTLRDTGTHRHFAITPVVRHLPELASLGANLHEAHWRVASEAVAFVFLDQVVVNATTRPVQMELPGTQRFRASKQRVDVLVVDFAVVVHVDDGLASRPPVPERRTLRGRTLGVVKEGCYWVTLKPLRLLPFTVTAEDDYVSSPKRRCRRRSGTRSQ